MDLNHNIGRNALFKQYTRENYSELSEIPICYERNNRGFLEITVVRFVNGPSAKLSYMVIGVSIWNVSLISWPYDDKAPTNYFACAIFDSFRS